MICTKIYRLECAVCKFKKKECWIYLVRGTKNTFDILEVIITKKPAEKIFDLAKDITLTTDASEHSISGILAWESHPMIYFSRRITNTEFNYSNIKKEALAIVWTTTRARQILIGKELFWERNHNPLEFIFNPGKELPKATTSRILKWTIRLMAFDFNIKCQKKCNSTRRCTMKIAILQGVKRKNRKIWRYSFTLVRDWCFVFR